MDRNQDDNPDTHNNDNDNNDNDNDNVVGGESEAGSPQGQGLVPSSSSSNPPDDSHPLSNGGGGGSSGNGGGGGGGIPLDADAVECVICLTDPRVGGTTGYLIIYPLLV